jgi:Txe/YoeB family toxin of toxin-antitoxin system
MVTYKVFYGKRTKSDAAHLKSAGLDGKARELIEVIKNDPYTSYPPYEKLKGDLRQCYSRRINIKHRIVNKVNEDAREIYILSMWSHYEQ